ncbi:hypothetical protein RX330_22910 [Bradyrhizobium sp. NDS-1]|uniref:hypothetical protein n=1 Tax=Bradyrhizobium sp. NDS-1 TaxID=3080014 RepID=UPI00293F107D|nr:hypothetical protein [Bradyrhizobium sp. NDS-1]WOH71133.1 hypothetical protein RX330_22910 [Bradyrhizobium sp. NDS-1]
MRVAFATSTHNFGFRNTVIAFTVKGGPIEVFRDDSTEQRSLYVFFALMIQRCPRNERLVLQSSPKPATQVVQNLKQHEANRFEKKAYRPELVALNDLSKSRSVEIVCEPIAGDKMQQLDDHLRLVRTGRLKERPINLAPGDPPENPWGRAKETFWDWFNRAIRKDQRGER